MTIKDCQELAQQYGWQCDVIRDTQSAQSGTVATGHKDTVLFWRGHERRRFPRDEVKRWGMNDLINKLA